MKKIIFIIFSFLIFCNTFSINYTNASNLEGNTMGTLPPNNDYYYPNDKDNILLSNLYKKIDNMAKKSPERLKKISIKIVGMLDNFDKASRNYYLLDVINNYIKTTLGYEEEQFDDQVINLFDDNTSK